MKPRGIIAGDDWQPSPEHRHHGVCKAGGGLVSDRCASSRAAPHTQLLAGVFTGVILYAGLPLLMQRQAIDNLRSILRKHGA
jgi:hypothetical protein